MAIEFRWANGRYDRLPALAADLMKQKIAVLVAVGGELGARSQGSNLHDSHRLHDRRRPHEDRSGRQPESAGRNATGLSTCRPLSRGKRLAMLHELVPKAAPIAVLINLKICGLRERLRELSAAARTLGGELTVLDGGTERELELAFAAIAQENRRCASSYGDPFFDTGRNESLCLSRTSRLPTIYPFREFATAGGLMSYGISITEGYRQAGIYAAQHPQGSQARQTCRFTNRPSSNCSSISRPPRRSASTYRTSCSRCADEVIE